MKLSLIVKGILNPKALRGLETERHDAGYSSTQCTNCALWLDINQFEGGVQQKASFQ